jgi:hypothetical protein
MKSRHAPATITVHVPMAFAIRGGRKMIISDIPHSPSERLHQSVEGASITLKLSRQAASQRTNNAMLKALAKAYRWRRMIESGAFTSITELAEAESVNQSYACRILRLTLLAPNIVTEILDGQHSSNLMLKRVMRLLPTRWNEQTAILKAECSPHEPCRVRDR